MASSKLDIWNLALSRIGHSELVANPDEGSLASDLCGLHYDQCLDYVLEDFPWRFAKRRSTLAIIAGTPPLAWGYQYAIPADCLRIRALTNPLTRTPLAEAKIPFERATDGTSNLLYTDLPDAELIYTMRITDVSRFDSSFVSALTYYLASELAIPLRGAAGGALADAMLNKYMGQVRIAAAKSLSEGFDTTPDGEFLQARNG